MSFGDKLKKKMNRRRVRNLSGDLPEIQENKIVFHASNDFSDNCLALYEYMVEIGLDRKYEIVWLVKDVAKCKARNRKKPGGNARFVKSKDDRLNMWLYEAQREAMSANYLFCTHGFGWIRVKRQEQTFVNLWHGCGYKGEKARADGKEKKQYFDYCTVTGPKYVDIQAKLFGSEKEQMIPTGYARTDWFVTEKEAAGKFCDQLKEDAKASKAVIWMPTFRQSHIARLDDGTKCGELGLPLVETAEELEQINALCSELGILLIIKTHNLQKAYTIEDMSNIRCIDDGYLEEKEVNLYGLMANTDGLISDYSSAAIDYMLLDKPIGYILDDFEEYEKVRGWDIENVKDYMPGDHIYTLTELKQFIEEIAEGADPYREWRNRVNGEVNVEGGNHRKRIVDLLDL